MIMHTVKRGDTVSKLAKKYGTTVAAIVKENGLKNPDLIIDGHVLRIPVAEEKPVDTQVKEAFITCLSAVESLPEYKTLCKLLGV